jgi:hypothetical protein
MTIIAKDLTDNKLVSMLHTVTTTLFDIESKKLKVTPDVASRVVANAHALTDELELRGLEGRYHTEAPAGLRARMLKRGVR